MDQLRPGFVGSVSVSVTVLAVPAPVFETVILNPMGLPPLTGVASGSFVTVTSGHLTVIEAEPELLVVLASLLAEAEAVLLTVAHVAGVVGELICTDLLVPEVIVPKLHVSTPLLIEQ